MSPTSLHKSSPPFLAVHRTIKSGSTAGAMVEQLCTEIANFDHTVRLAPPNPDWGGAKVRIPLEDDALVTERGVEWLYPTNQRIWLIK